MGVYDTYGNLEIQLKVGPCTCQHFNVGETVPLEDGVYFGYEGAIVVVNSMFVAEFLPSQIRSKWGDVLGIDLNRVNPVAVAVEKITHIAEHPSDHVHEYLELIECCTINGAIDTSLIEVHSKFVDLGSNGGIKCDSIEGPCACGAWHEKEQKLDELRRKNT